MINIVNIDFTTGVQEEYKVPSNTGSIAFHAVGGDVTTRSASSGDTWTMSNGERKLYRPAMYRMKSCTSRAIPEPR